MSKLNKSATMNLAVDDQGVEISEPLKKQTYKFMNFKYMNTEGGEGGIRLYENSQVYHWLKRLNLQYVVKTAPKL